MFFNNIKIVNPDSPIIISDDDDDDVVMFEPQEANLEVNVQPLDAVNGVNNNQIDDILMNVQPLDVLNYVDLGSPEIFNVQQDDNLILNEGDDQRIVDFNPILRDEEEALNQQAEFVRELGEEEDMQWGYGEVVDDDDDEDEIDEGYTSDYNDEEEEEEVEAAPRLEQLHEQLQEQQHEQPQEQQFEQLQEEIVDINAEVEAALHHLLALKKNHWRDYIRTARIQRQQDLDRIRGRINRVRDARRRRRLQEGRVRRSRNPNADLPKRGHDVCWGCAKRFFCQRIRRWGRCDDCGLWLCPDCLAEPVHCQNFVL